MVCESVSEIGQSTGVLTYLLLKIKNSASIGMRALTYDFRNTLMEMDMDMGAGNQRYYV